jgi:hypothetical protein
MGKFIRQVVVIADNHIHTALAGIIHCLVGVNACIAGQDQIGAILDDPLQVELVDPMGFARPHRDVVADLPPQVAQAGDQ